jgi:general secretion pathway protein G
MTRDRHVGFTLIELLAVMAILATLLAIVAPQYFDSVDRAKEAALRADLRSMRDAIDKHIADTGRLPDSLQVLVTQKYLRNVPVDPLTDSPQSWVLVSHPDGQTPGVYDVRSGAPGIARDGSAFVTW